MKMGEERVKEVLFETRRHASRPYSSNYPPLPRQPNEGGKRSLLSFLSTQGLYQLKERWREYRHPTRKSGRPVNLFVSARGNRVAVALGNQITILHREDDYQEPQGIFTCESTGSFTSGIWSEDHDVLGVADDTDTIYFIKANGEEITRTTKRHLKVPLPVIGLVLSDHTDLNKSCLCTFSVLISDGSLHDIEISQDLCASVLSERSSSNASIKKQFPHSVFCWDYHHRLSLFALVCEDGSPHLTSNDETGSYRVSLWQRKRKYDLEQVVSAQLKGLYCEQKSCVGQLASAKVSISPEGKYVATSDTRGCLFIFELDRTRCSLSSYSYEERYCSQVREYLTDIMDFAWWSDGILVIATRNGAITMFNVATGDKMLKDDFFYAMPILERAQELFGYLFVLENTSSDKQGNSIEQTTLDQTKLCWSLVSFSERSVSEMYDILINSQEYHTALSFAACHGLDKDEVLKSQWSHSCQGVDEINTLLSAIGDSSFVLSECVDTVGPSEDAERALLAYGLRLTDSYRFLKPGDEDSDQNWEFRVARLKLLHSRDRLETFLGINMGRFSLQEYRKFRDLPINVAAVTLAESGKIGALNLLFKRHPYSLMPWILEVLAAIPETVPVQTYGQLLPGKSPPSSISLREEDWVECDEMISFIQRLPEKDENISCVRTEPIVRRCMGSRWPSSADVSKWYKERARQIDTLTGQLDNCMCLIELALQRGVTELQEFLEDIAYLHQLIYSDDSEDEIKFSTSLVTWEQLPDYEKFKVMLIGVKDDNVIKRLHSKAMPFMQKRFRFKNNLSGDDSLDTNSTSESFLVSWLKEIASDNKLDTCLMIIEEGCRNIQERCFFCDEAEVVGCALQCIYSCTATDKWNTMASILLKLPPVQDSECEHFNQRLKLAEGHIEAGRILALYQVPKPISFFLEAHSDGKGAKQILRLILSKFIRRQPGRSDNDWTNMWHDLQTLHEKAFPFLDLEYMLIEFCRGLLKAGKFSLARSYLKGTSSVTLATDKAENLVIQAAREYFFSASSLACSEIWKAKECLNIFPSSRNVKAEADIIDAVTVKLPNFGVNLLPIEFRQIKDPMEIIKLAITSQGGAYLNVDELVEIAKLLGLNSQDDISAVQEAIAREAAVTGDLQLAFDLCLIVAKKGHGSVWDLCAALARGPALENMDINSRKQLLGFALSHCDEESIGELLHAWKDLDMQGQCENLVLSTGREPPTSHDSSTICSSVDLRGWSDNMVENNLPSEEAQFECIKKLLSSVATNLAVENDYDWESVRENGKILSFAASWLPWLLELSQDAESCKKFSSISGSKKPYSGIQTQAVLTILSWLARNGFAPKDNVIASLAKSVLEPPVTEQEDTIACSFLLNLVDAVHGVQIIEEQVRTRGNYNEISSIMNMGMIYGLLHNSGDECHDPAQRKALLLRKFQQKQTPLSSDERDKIDEAQSTFWREWKRKLEEQKRVADHSRALESIIPGVESARFLSADVEYIRSVLLNLVETVKPETNHILKDAVGLARTYGLNHTEVLLHYMETVLISEAWTFDDIISEIPKFRGDLLSSPAEAIKAIYVTVFPVVDGHDKLRLACMYGLLSDLYLQLEESKHLLSTAEGGLEHDNILRLAHFYKTAEEECIRLSFIRGLNFKNISGLRDLNFNCFNNEVCAHINENTVEALATMVQNFSNIYGNVVPEGLISWKDVYVHLVLNLLANLENRAKAGTDFQSPEAVRSFIGDIEQAYHTCRKYLTFIEYAAAFDMVKRLFKVILPIGDNLGSLTYDSSWQDCLIALINFWLKLLNDIQEFEMLDQSVEEFSKCLQVCFDTFISWVMKGKVSTQQGWVTAIGYIENDLLCSAADEIFNFCRSLVFSGCGFEVIASVFSESVSQCAPGSSLTMNCRNSLVTVQDLPHFYLTTLDSVLHDLSSGCVEKQKLHCLILSLAKLEGNLDDLKNVRNVVWKRMTEFSDNLHLPSHVRVYALEVMQSIAGRGKSLKGFSSELQSNVLPWEGWTEVQGTTANNENISKNRIADTLDTSSRFANTLVALKSTELVSAFFPSIEITSEDLSTLDSAVACFLKLSESATSGSQVDALVALLGEWDGLFMSEKGESDSTEVGDTENSWSNDDWDEGWENFQEPIEKEVKKDQSPILHPLHVCWVQLLKKLVMVSHYNDLFKLIDRSTAKAEILVDEQGARDLGQSALGVDCFLAFKIILLLPYEAVQLQILDAVEDTLKQGGLTEKIAQDHELFILLLSSGIVSKIVSSSSYGTVFSSLCYIVGKFSRQYQELQVKIKNGETIEDEVRRKNTSSLFMNVLFPFFLSELVKSDQHLLAGLFISKLMHTSASLSMINVADASLRRYLERQLQVLNDGQFSWEDLDIWDPIQNTVGSLRGKFGDVIQSAINMLRVDDTR